MKTLIFLTTAAASAVVAAAPASAVTFIAETGSAAAFSASANGAQVTFDNAATSGFAVSGGALAAGSVANQSANPFGAAATNAYAYVRGSSVATVTSLAETFGNISVYLGSLDAGNTIDVLGIGGAVLRSFSGSDLATPAAANGNQASGLTNRAVTFSAGAGEQLTGLRFSTNGNALEFDNVRFSTAAAVPEPATWGMMMLGLGVIGYAMRRRPTARYRQAV
ncbi:hypothetical protein J2Y58_000333 [Sphingomonas sp. BE138]|uniref:Npun_F0296 family exosortase-dependent surface protein n=1 Tax=Sphingomonas sp. BE138 TaxID=2817845 RepID=UPI00285A56D3|nr:PEPxxWA-CTERM sorting domain-containing protein [Sphingomonas sp. BE138]MDR6786995.1 hypothetical protein [Sphingomonas sp. BE138]